MTETKPTRGGRRTGAGRPRGSVNKRSDELADKLDALGCDPAEGLARIASEALAENDRDLAARCYSSLLPYLYAKLKLSEISITQVDMAESILAARQRLRDARDGIACTPIPATMPVMDFVQAPEPVQAAAPLPAPPPTPRPAPSIPTWVARPTVQTSAPTFAQSDYNLYGNE